jgi:hypothetical protein
LKIMLKKENNGSRERAIGCRFHIDDKGDF